MGYRVPMDEAQLIAKLEQLSTEHRDLDAAIDAMAFQGSSDHLAMARLKKRKLQLKDQIGSIRDQLIPDIIA